MLDDFCSNFRFDGDFFPEKSLGESTSVKINWPFANVSLRDNHVGYPTIEIRQLGVTRVTMVTRVTRVTRVTKGCSIFDLVFSFFANQVGG